MRETATIAQAFFDAAEAVSSIAKVEFITAFIQEDLKHIRRTPLLLISPYMMYLSYSRHRQRGTQLLLNTFLISRQQRLERDESAAIELMGVLDDLDAAVVDNAFDLDIQPFDIYRREARNVFKGMSIIRTIYSTLIYTDLDYSKFTYTDENNVSQDIEFTMVPTSFQTEDERDTNDYDWTLDGGIKSYARTPKKRYELRFTLIPEALKNQLYAMKQAGGEITYYRDKNADATMTCVWSSDFDFYEERSGYWTGKMILHEV